MTRIVWDTIKHSKRFHVVFFRRVSTITLCLVGLNLCLGLLLFQAYLNQPDRDFYATNGETSPQALTSMDDPNYTSTPLLAEDVIRDSGARALPQ